MKATVAIVRCEEYKPSSTLRAVKEAADLLGGMERFVQPGQRVLLKPNLLSPKSPESAVCTHPAVVEAVASLAKAAGGSCSIGDSPCINAETEKGYKKLIEVTGVGEVAHRTGAEIVRFDEGGTEREIPDAKVFRRVTLADALDSADVLVNIPKFKTHDLTKITCAVKNLFGCVPGRRKIEYHFQAGKDPETFAQILVDIAAGAKPQLSVLDGVTGMDGNGPSAGRRRNFGVILASADPFALDSIACALAGVDPMDIPMLRLGGEQKAGVTDLEMIEVLGAGMDEAKISDFLLPEHGGLTETMPSGLVRFLRNQFVVSPVIAGKRCTLCRACVNACPTEAIECGERVRIDYSRCIRCYCCREVCMQEAIDLRSGRFRRILEGAFEVRHRIRRMRGKD